MFFALVANDSGRFEGLLRWTELNLASGDLTAHLPAWLWGKDSQNRCHVLDENSASDADVWMATRGTQPARRGMNRDKPR
jgi:endoglucanase